MTGQAAVVFVKTHDVNIYNYMLSCKVKFLTDDDVALVIVSPIIGESGTSLLHTYHYFFCGS